MNPISPAELKLAAQKIPPSPQIFGKLGRLLKSPETDLGDITDLVHTDSALTAQVLRLSNSALFGQGTPIDNLDDAINRIGFRELFKLVGMAAASDVFSGRNETYNIDSSLIWENSLCCGIAMETLAQKLGLDDQEAYTMGLLRSIGKLVIDLCVQKLPEPASYPTGENPPLAEWEESHFSISSPRVAGFLLTTWNFPEDTAAAIQNQYNPEKASKPSPLTSLLNLSASIAEKLGKGLPGESGYFTSPELRAAQLRLSESHLNETQEFVAIALQKVLSSV